MGAWRQAPAGSARPRTACPWRHSRPRSHMRHPSRGPLRRPSAPRTASPVTGAHAPWHCIVCGFPGADSAGPPLAELDASSTALVNSKPKRRTKLCSLQHSACAQGGYPPPPPCRSLSCDPRYCCLRACERVCVDHITNPLLVFNQIHSLPVQQCMLLLSPMFVNAQEYVLEKG